MSIILNSYGNFLQAEDGAAQLPKGLPVLPMILVADFKLSKFAEPGKTAFNRPATAVEIGFGSSSCRFVGKLSAWNQGA